MTGGRGASGPAPALAWGAGLLVAASCGGAAPAPVLSPWAAAPAVVVVPERGATAVGVALALPGSGWEDDGTSGLTLFSARAVLEEVTPVLEALGSEVEVACGRWSLVVTLVSPPETWREAAAVVASGLRRPEPSLAALERARASLAGMLSLDRSNPAWQARLAADRALYGADGAGDWRAPPCGVVETLDLFGPSAVAGMAGRLGSVRAVAVVGAADAVADSVVRELFRPASPPVPFPLPGAPAAGRVFVERNTVTSWLVLAWPFGREADAEAVRLVGALLEEAVGPDAARPHVLHVTSDVELHGEGGALVLTAVTAPEAAAAVASSLEAAAARLAESGGSSAVLERAARRHRGERLRALATPESRAARVALARVRGGEAGPWPERGSYSAAAVRAAARALGEPARAVVGPRAARGAVVP